MLGWTSTRQTRCPQIAEYLEEPPGLAAPLTWTLEETLGAWSLVRDRVQTGGARSAFCGTVGDDGASFLCSGPFLEGPQTPRIEKTVVVPHLSDFLPIFQKAMADLARQSIQQTAPGRWSKSKSEGRCQVMKLSNDTRDTPS